MGFGGLRGRPLWEAHITNATNGEEGEYCTGSRVWCVVCGVWCVVCGVWCVVCGVWCIV
jgi:hypothetical protein